MKLARLTAAIVAAATAITPLSLNIPLCTAFTASAEETNAAKLPSWVPDSFDSAIEFRNTYGATHIGDGLICIVIENEDCSQGTTKILRYNTITTENALETVSRRSYPSDQTIKEYEVIVYKPLVQGEIEVDLIDTLIQAPSLDLGYYHGSGYYTFNVDSDNNITETDIFSWLPDCKEEFRKYTNDNSLVSVTDNYVVFCLSYSAGTPGRWTVKDNGKKCFENEVISDCSYVSSVPLDGGGIDTIYVYKAVNDGCDRIAYDFINVNSEDEVIKSLDADCAVFNNAQSVLLSGEMQVTLVDYDTGELLTIDKNKLPYIWTDVSYDTPEGKIQMNSQPYGFRKNPGVVGLGSFFDADNFSFGLQEDTLPTGYSLPETDGKAAGYYNGTIVPEGSMTVTRFDNKSADVVFRLKNKNAANEKKTTKITFYDKDTGKLIDISEADENVYLLKCTSGTPSTSEMFYFTSNPGTVDSLYVYEPSCSYSFHSDTQSGWYDSLEFETVSEKSDSMELICRMKWNPDGDLNGDGSLNISDAVIMQKWLLGTCNTKFSNWKAADFCRDERIDVFDLIMMRKKILQATVSMPVSVSISTSGGFTGATSTWKVYKENDKCILYYDKKEYNVDTEPLIIQISEEDYLDIMTQDYNGIIDNYNNSPHTVNEESNRTVITYADGSKTETNVPMTTVSVKINGLKDKYLNNQNAYVEPDNKLLFGSPFIVTGEGVKLFLGPDESYEAAALIPVGTHISEIGYNTDNNDWIFVEYNGQYGWVYIQDSVKADDSFGGWRKPVIYLYPEKETDVHVELELTGAELSTTYPKYNNGWDVTAYPDGSLLNKADGTHHKYLFWDAVNCNNRFDLSRGFCVAGSDTESFLREKLTYMGMTEEEMNEFIVYWLPELEHNKYNLIAFQGDIYTNAAKLDITPSPDSLLRVFMTYVPLEEAVEIEPQQLDTFEREGFTVVEWGGSRIG